MNTTLIVKNEAIMRQPLGLVQREVKSKAVTDEVVDELNSWDEEGRAIAEQIINRFPYLFPYFSKN